MGDEITPEQGTTSSSHLRLPATEESTPLLTNHENTADGVAIGYYDRWPSIPVFMAALVLLSHSMASSLAATPIIRLLEDSICRTYYYADQPSDVGRLPIDERLCKIDAIQTRLAYFNSWVSMMEATLSLIAAFPYASLADRVGRRIAIALATTGTLLSLTCVVAVLRLDQWFPLEALLFSPFCLLIGGGYYVVVSSIYSIVGDFTSPSRRTSAFFVLSSGSLIGVTIGPAVSSALMKKGSPWSAIMACYGVMASGLVILTTIPETIIQNKTAFEESPQLENTLQKRLRRNLQRVKSESLATWGMLKHRSLFLILFIFLTMGPHSQAASQFLMQYISKRFDWSIADTGFLLTLQGIVNLFLFFAILPAFSTYLQSASGPFHLSPGTKDKLLAFVSTIFISVGSLILAVDSIAVDIAGLIIFTFGAGLAPICRSLAAYYIDTQNASKLQTLISIMETAGMLYAGPLLASLFDLGMRLGGIWTGLPYLGVAGISLIGTVAIFWIRLPEE
ncbi:major facilitator superfamily domain-containing protein [Trichoderma evansii]